MQALTPFPRGREVLILEDDAVLRRRLVSQLKTLEAHVTEADRIGDARRLLKDLHFDFALIDLQLPDGEALDLLREGAFSETTGVVVMTAFGGVQKAVEAMRLGAGDYLSKPFEPEAVPLAFVRCLTNREVARREEHRLADTGSSGLDLFFGRSLEAVRTRLDSILATERRLTRSIPPIVIEGETGTGKSALARWLHQQGPRAARPFVVMNCAALPEHLVESEVFGHERGAFTDAKHARIGLFEAANGGTLFLDEVGTLSLATQAKLLLAVDEGRIRRLGSNQELTIDVRLLAATNRPLETLVKQGLFREDLFHRLNLLSITLPPLRERGTDVAALATLLLSQLAKRHHLPSLSLTPSAQTHLLARRWPGNIRELAHELERAVIFEHGPALELAHLNPIASSTSGSTWRNPAWRLPEAHFSLDAVVGELVADALRETQGNVSAAARRLGVSREFIRYRLPKGTADLLRETPLP